jgi:hypothetical protein
MYDFFIFRESRHFGRIHMAAHEAQAAVDKEVEENKYFMKKEIVMWSTVGNECVQYVPGVEPL